MLSRQRLITTFRNGIARPFVLKNNSKHLDLASNLVHLFADSIGRRRFEIEEHIKTFNIEKVNPKVVQGLSELLFKRSSFDDLSAADAVDMRKQLFSMSAEYWKKVGKTPTGIMQHRRNILQAAGNSSAIPQTVEEHQLFGDIAANQKLTEFNTIPAEQLVHRFNIAQVQGLLINSRSLELKIHRRNSPAIKQLMQMMKFFRLMFELTEAENDWLIMKIDGPGAVLENSRSYGLEIAQFFPAVLLLNVPWQLTTRLKVPNRRRIFTLDITDSNPYHSHFQLRNVWTHEKTTILLDRFNDKYGETHQANSDTQIVQLKDNRYLLPDFSIEKTEKSGRETPKLRIQFEWIHYPSQAKLKWIRQVKSQLPENYVFAVRGKRDEQKQLIKSMGKHILIYAKELTAPAILKKFEQEAE